MRGAELSFEAWLVEVGLRHQNKALDGNQYLREKYAIDVDIKKKKWRIR